jgi:uncharacterized protein
VADDLRDRLQSTLRGALKAQDKSAIAALRSALAAIDNAQAIPASEPATTEASSEHFAGTAVGLQAAEAERQALAPEQVAEIVRTEITDRREAAEHYRRAGHDDMADQLDREASALSAVVD